MCRPFKCPAERVVARSDGSRNVRAYIAAARVLRGDSIRESAGLGERA